LAPCERCGGTGFAISESGGVSRARPCDCRTALGSPAGLEARLAAARVPRRYAACDFTSYAAYGDFAFSLANARTKALRYAEEYPLSDRGLLFMGPPGVGKTHLAVATLRKLIADKGIACLFVDVQDLLRRLQATFDRALGMSQLDLLQPVLTTEVVVLDDLGGRQYSPWVEETLAHIVTTRYNDERATLVTTNYLDHPPDERTQTLEDRIGVRVRSRLHEMCHLVELQAEDFRRAVRRADHHRITDRIERPEEPA
jgi:DNA replication protein DnaC